VDPQDVIVSLAEVGRPAHVAIEPAANEHDQQGVPGRGHVEWAKSVTDRWRLHRVAAG